jgi:hypothetical protein
VPRAIAADSEKAPVALLVRLARELRDVALRSGGHNINVQFFFAHAGDGRASQLRRAAATSGGVDDGKKSFH